MILDAIRKTGIEPVELTERDRRMARKVNRMVGWATGLPLGDVEVADSFHAVERVTIDAVQLYGSCHPHTDDQWRACLFTTITVTGRKLPPIPYNYTGLPSVCAIGQRGRVSSYFAAPYTAFVLDPMRTHWMHMMRPAQWRAVQVVHPRTMTPREALDIACDWVEAK